MICEKNQFFVSSGNLCFLSVHQLKIDDWRPSTWCGQIENPRVRSSPFLPACFVLVSYAKEIFVKILSVHGFFYKKLKIRRAPKMLTTTVSLFSGGWWTKMVFSAFEQFNQLVVFGLFSELSTEEFRKLQENLRFSRYLCIIVRNGWFVVIFFALQESKPSICYLRFFCRIKFCRIASSGFFSDFPETTLGVLPNSGLRLVFSCSLSNPE